MSSSTPIQSRPAIPHITTTCTNCTVALEFPVPSPAPRSGSILEIRCFKCLSVFTHVFYPNQVPRGPSSQSAHSHNESTSEKRGGRKIGTDERPLETGYYDLLGVPVSATADDIKKSYRAYSNSPNPHFKLIQSQHTLSRSLGHQVPPR